MKSLNADQALWQTKENGSRSASANGVEPACCWFWGCCWYWGMSANPDEPLPQVS